LHFKWSGRRSSPDRQQIGTAPLVCRNLKEVDDYKAAAEKFRNRKEVYRLKVKLEVMQKIVFGLTERYPMLELKGDHACEVEEKFYHGFCFNYVCVPGWRMRHRTGR
jgi:hypothetical protein